MLRKTETPKVRTALKKINCHSFLLMIFKLMMDTLVTKKKFGDIGNFFWQDLNTRCHFFV